MPLQYERGELNEAVSGLYEKLLRQDSIDFKRPYHECRGYLVAACKSFAARSFQMDFSVVQRKTKRHAQIKVQYPEISNFGGWFAIPDERNKKDAIEVTEIMFSVADKRERMIMDLYMDGLNFRQIGKKIGMSGTGAYKVIERFGKRNRKLYKEIR
jgi:hypothetical protein